MSQSLRLEFARSNTKVSKPVNKQAVLTSVPPFFPREHAIGKLQIGTELLEGYLALTQDQPFHYQVAKMTKFIPFNLGLSRKNELPSNPGFLGKSCETDISEIKCINAKKQHKTPPGNCFICFST